MDNRYEILEQIGQGRMGSVQRAFDRKMNRQVAIKRIHIGNEDSAFQAHVAKQLTVEVGALSALQHPHIVTVFDVGEDEAGPYVIMEMLDGKTLHEILGNGPLAWEDFRIIALQSLEALLAAHDLGMIHGDLKPSNIILVWMPSGAFQVKILDFGLARLIESQSRSEIEMVESVSDSVHYMSPEQFERKTLDARSDLYSLACCFYQVLAAIHPFNGDTVASVIQAHLDHVFVPLQEIRSDLPAWACEWVMGMLSRDPCDRPPSAREALAEFLHRERQTKAAAIDFSASSHQPSLVSPQTLPTHPPGDTIEHAETAHSVENLASSSHSSLGPTGLFPSVGTHATSISSKQKKPINKLVWIAIPAVAAFLVASAVWLMKRNEAIRQKDAYYNIITMAAQPNVRQIHISGEQLQLLFDFIVSSGPNTNLAPAIESLKKASATDATIIDAKIAEFTTTANVSGDVRRELFDEVIRHRQSSESIPAIMKYLSVAWDPELASVALDAILPMLAEEDLGTLVGLITSSEHENVRLLAESRITEILANPINREALAELLTKARSETSHTATRQQLDRLLVQSQPKKEVVVSAPPPPRPAAESPARPQQASSELDLEVARLVDAFEASDDDGKLEIIATLGRTPHRSIHGILREMTAAEENARFKIPMIRALTEFNARPDMRSGDEAMRQRWAQVLWRCDTVEERKIVIDALAGFREEWATGMINDLRMHRNQEVSAYADHVMKQLLESADD